jgi:hypothetical protein
MVVNIQIDCRVYRSRFIVFGRWIDLKAIKKASKMQSPI